MKDPRRNLRSYRNKVAREKNKASKMKEPTLCHLCGKAIDLTLPYFDAMAFTLDHLESLKSGGHILGPTLPAHRSCNSKKGDGLKADPLEGATRKWL
ncbi:HNH endonuclease [Streptomyces lasalocidi]|uniref:HNH endonuclease n=1 Tax=Streptomyces lasalocidi TaxID=324833 RepID=A0A4U5WML6_STRLS|nr:HNH endonuclease [Streptomyces lasalocidi]TKT03434.1 HNH endonuclease [Streptomyces lasalocidi]